MPTTYTYNVTITTPSTNKYQVAVNGIDLRGKGTGIVLQWQIDQQNSPTWSFVNPPPPGARGVDIKNPGSAFTFGSAGAKVCTWTRNSSDNNLYDYTLSVTNGQTTLIIDPSIINQP